MRGVFTRKSGGSGARRGLFGGICESPDGLDRATRCRLELEEHERHLERLVQLGDNVLPGEVRRMKRRVRHFKVRASLQGGFFSRFWPAFREYRQGNYRRFSKGWSSFVSDLFC